MHAQKWVTGSLVADRVLYFCSSSYFGGAGVNYFKWWMTLFGKQVSFHWYTQEWVRVLLSLSQGWIDGCLPPLQHKFDFMTHTTLRPSFTSCFSSRVAKHFGSLAMLSLPQIGPSWSAMRCSWPHPPAAGQTHCSPTHTHTHTLCISPPSHADVGQSQSFSLSINIRL